MEQTLLISNLVVMVEVGGSYRYIGQEGGNQLPFQWQIGRQKTQRLCADSSDMLLMVFVKSSCGLHNLY